MVANYTFRNIKIYLQMGHSKELDLLTLIKAIVKIILFKKMKVIVEISCIVAIKVKMIQNLIIRII